MKKIFSILFLIVLFCCACTQKSSVNNDLHNKILKRGYMVVGVKTDAYPFGYINEKGKNAGFDIDLAKVISKYIFDNENKVKFIPVTASDRITKLYSDEVDMLIATMSVTPSRAEILDFSKTYYIAGQSLLVNKGSNIKSLADLNNKTAIIVFGSTAERSLRAAVPNVKIIGYKSYNDALAALKGRKADAIVSDNTILLGMAHKDSSLQLLPKKYSKEPYAIAFKKGEESDEMLRITNEAIDNAITNGTMNKLLGKYNIK